MDNYRDDEDAEYEVGYKKPPKKNQFKKGNKAACGKRKMKKRKSIGDNLRKILGEKTLVKANGEQISMNNDEVIARAIVRKAQQGNLAAVKYIEDIGGTALVQTQEKEYPESIRITFVKPKPLSPLDD